MVLLLQRLYQHLLHLIHIPTFFGKFLLFELNSYFSRTFFLQIHTSPTFLPVLLTGHPDQPLSATNLKNKSEVSNDTYSSS